MSAALMIAPFLAPSLVALGYLCRQVYEGRAKVQQTHYEGVVKMIRAERGDAEPLIIQVLPAPRDHRRR